MRLPEEFIKQMQTLLGEQWQDFQTAWEGPPFQGLRVNTLKISREDFLARSPFKLEPILWTEEGFYFSGEERPAKHPYYQAGLYYLQEPSAMSSAACLGIRPGDKVLDLCAAPGGKSTQLAALLKGEGLLVSNDNSSERVKALVWNLEHWGAANTIITNEEPVRLAGFFPEYFDRILVDAPCSGEGMFRKDPRAVKSWSSYNSEICSAMQREILFEAAKMLKPGGRMLYSTCTFSPRENEETIASFLKEHSNFTLVSLPLDYGWEPGRLLNNCGSDSGYTDRTRRLWPHKVKGEGHFLALLEKHGNERDDRGNHNYDDYQYNESNNKNKHREYQYSKAKKEHSRQEYKANKYAAGYGEQDDSLAAVQEFMAENLVKPLAGSFVKEGHYIYRIPGGIPSLKGLKVVRPGWFVGVVKNGRFEPSQALAMGLQSSEVRRRIRFSLNDHEVEKYLKGETLLREGEKGWTLVCLEEFPLGWAKQTGDYLKNFYPPGWRMLDKINVLVPSKQAGAN